MKRVLVADDEPGIRALIAEVLEEEGYDVQTCADGLSALFAIRNETPAIAVLDVAMPGMTGDELVRQLHSEGNNLPAIIMTAGTHPERFLHSGAVAVLAKPFDLHTLLELIRTILANKKQGRERTVGGFDAGGWVSS